MPSDSEIVNAHIDQCLEDQKQIQDTQTQKAEKWDEYEWNGVTRVRASALLEGGISGAFHVSSKDEEDLDIDIDNDDEFGPPQYKESDVQEHQIEITAIDDIEDNPTPSSKDKSSGSALIIESLKEKIKELVIKPPLLMK